MRSPLKRRVRAVLPLVAGLALLAAGCGSSGNGTGVSVQQVSGSSQIDSHYPGALVTPVVGKPTVTLTDTSGQPYDVATATAGQVTLVYFGYTNCPDVCPINMALATTAVRSLPAADQARVTVVFITTDPNRDTPQAIHAWLGNFPAPRLVGLTGTITQIDAAEKEVGMPLSVAVPAGSGGDYEIEHAGYILAYSTDNQAHLEIDDTASLKQFDTTLEHLLSGGFQP